MTLEALQKCLDPYAKQDLTFMRIWSRRKISLRLEQTATLPTVEYCTVGAQRESAALRKILILSLHYENIAPRHRQVQPCEVFDPSLQLPKIRTRQHPTSKARMSVRFSASTTQPRKRIVVIGYESTS